MNHDYVIFVLPTPWRWVSLLNLVLIVSFYGWHTWRQRRARRALLAFGEGLADIAARAGLPEQVAIIEAQLAKLQRKPRWWRVKQAPVEVSQ